MTWWEEGADCEPHELAWCSICKPKAKAPPAPSTGGAPRFRQVSALGILATYDGVCVECDDEILAGVDNIRRDQDGNWIHEAC